MGCSSGGHTMVLNGMRSRDSRYASVPLPGGENVDASLRFMLCCWPVLDPHARYMWAKEIGEERFIGPTEDYFPEHSSLHEGNPQEILDRGEPVELPPAIIIQGTNDNNIPLSFPTSSRSHTVPPVDTWSWSCSRGCPTCSGTRPAPNQTGLSS